MLFGSIAAKSLSSHFEFTRAVAKGQETQDPEQDTNGFGADVFDSSNVDGLRVITEPVAKVDLIQLVDRLANEFRLTYSLDIKL